MRKLSKTQLDGRTLVCDKLRDTYLVLEGAVEKFNTALDDLWQKVEDAEAKYNTVVQEANEWRENIASEIEEFIQEKSDKWQEGDKGQAYVEWHTQYDAIELQDVDLERPESLSLDDGDQADILEELDEELTT